MSKRKEKRSSLRSVIGPVSEGGGLSGGGSPLEDERQVVEEDWLT